MQGTAPPQSTEADQTIFDIYIGDQFVGNIVTSFTDEWFEIESPQDVAEQLLPKLKGGEKELLKLFTGRIPGKREEAGIGSITYDPTTFRILLGVDPKYLKAGGVKRGELLPDPDKSFSFQNMVQSAVSGTISESVTAVSLGHRTVAALGKFFGRAEGNYMSTGQDTFGNLFGPSGNDDDTTTGEYRLDELYGGTFYGSFRHEVGLLRSRGSSLVNTVDYAGTRLENERQLFADDNLLTGSSFRIFVPSRSRVQFYQSGRLLSTQLLNSGLQEVDTSAFPQGSYDVDVVMNEDSGNIIRERHFFAKSGSIVMSGHPLWAFEGGYFRDQTDVESTWFGHGGVRFRGLSFLELNPNYYGSQGVNIGSFDLGLIWQQHMLRLGGAWGSGSNRGAQGSVYVQLPWTIGVYGSRMKTESDEDSDSAVLSSSTTNVDKLEIAPDVDSYDFRVNRMFDQLELYYAAHKTNRARDERNPTDTTQSFNERRYARGPGFSWYIYSKGQDTVRLQTSYLQTDEGNGVQAYLSWNKTLTGNWLSTTSVSSLNYGETRHRAAEAGVRYYDYTQGQRGKSFYLTEQLREDKTSTSDEPGGIYTTERSAMTNAQYEYSGDSFRSRGYLQDQRGDVGSSTSLGMTADTSLVMSGGAFALSNPVSGDSGLLAEINTDSGIKEDFDLIIDGTHYDTIPAGRSVLVGLSAYRTYSISLRQRKKSKDLIAYDGDDREVTLFPGNVAHQVWDVEKTFVALGRVVDTSGNPVALQRIKGTLDYTITEDDGSFQMELTGKEALRIESKKYRCSLKLPPVQAGEFVQEVGDLVCEGTQSDEVSS